MLAWIKSWPALLAAVAALLLAACQVVGQGESAQFGGTGPAAMPFDSAATHVELRASATIDSGRSEFSILDPSGTLRLRREVTATSPLNEAFSLDGPKGRWVAIIDYVGVSKGHRTVEWSYSQSRGSPVGSEPSST